MDDGFHLVTGASRGIGQAIADALEKSLSGVVVGTSTSAGTEGTWSSDRRVIVGYDASARHEGNALVDRLCCRYGPVRSLVLNAGIAKDDFLVHMTADRWRAVLETNLLSTHSLLQPALKSMMRQREGRVVFVSSVAAYGGADGQANYAASKAGQIGLCRAIAREYGARGITSNVVCPGPTDTEMLATMPEQRRAELLRRIPAGRFGLPSEVASVVAFLCSPSCAYVNGAVIPIDGGLGMGW